MRNRIPAEIIDLASEWFVEMREPAADLAQRERFSAWLRESPVHVQAYLEIASLWGDASQLDPACDFGVEEALKSGVDSPNVVAFAPTAGAPTPCAPADAGAVARTGATAMPEAPGVRGGDAAGIPRNVRRRLPGWSVAASLLLIFTAAAAAWWQLARTPVYAADVGEQRMITLDDGSIVRLNSRSRVRVELTPSERSVELLAGQALFEVAKDARRPFVVRSGDAAIRAVGTAFDVYRKESLGTVVTVVEGSVLVNRQGPAAAQTSPVPSAGLSLSAGEQILVTRAGTLERRKGDVAAATSWLRREMIFNGETLGVVVEEFNRYTRRTIVIDDPSLAALQINAVFHSTSPDALLKFVGRFEGVQVNESSSVIRISRREPT